jgi:hypothetical protein
MSGDVGRIRHHPLSHGGLFLPKFAMTYPQEHFGLLEIFPASINFKADIAPRQIAGGRLLYSEIIVVRAEKARLNVVLKDEIC